MQVNRLYLISDIHGYIDGLNDAEKVISSENPLFILGDLFDHKYGDEQAIVKKLCTLIKEDKCKLVFGNHDQVLYLMLFQIEQDYDKAYFELTHPSIKVVVEALKHLFSTEFADAYEEIRQKLLISDIDIKVAIDQYYSEVNKLCDLSSYREIYQQIKYLYENTYMYIEVSIGDKMFLLTHSGSVDNSESREVLTKSFVCNDKYTLQIMGHLTLPYVAECLKTESDPIPFSEFKDEYSNSEIVVLGTYMYNQYSNTLMIDDGSHTNLVEVYLK